MLIHFWIFYQFSDDFLGLNKEFNNRKRGGRALMTGEQHTAGHPKPPG